jgi:hypothetical protein
MKMRLRASLILLCVAAMPIAPALASDDSEIISRMQQTIDAGNKNDNAALIGNFMSSITIVDDLAPYAFEGDAAQAISSWYKAYGADSERNGVTDFSMKLLEAKHLHVEGDQAYIAVPAIYSFKEHGKPGRTTGVITATLEKINNKWLIKTWSWTEE